MSINNDDYVEVAIALLKLIEVTAKAARKVLKRGKRED